MKPVLQHKHVLFLTLRVFSTTGGIEKVCRVAGKALWEHCRETSSNLAVLSMYDEAPESTLPYFDDSVFRGFGGRRVAFAISGIRQGVKSDVVILSHINLLLFGILIKLFSPRTQLILYTHGIEVWKPFSFIRRRLLNVCDRVIAVSRFTKDQLVRRSGFPESKCLVINNCLDPHTKFERSATKPGYLLQRFRIREDDVVLLTLSRLSAHDRSKGYDKVLKGIYELSSVFPNLVYLIAGKYEQPEKEWLGQLVEQYGLQDKVVLAGYVGDAELSDYFSLSDVYIMPSIKEGFGIIFIEAMAFGLPVIAGNKDGSTDALADGVFGTLVDPYSQAEITGALKRVVANPDVYKPDREKVNSYFSYENFKTKLVDAVFCDI